MSGVDVLCQDQWQLTPATWINRRWPTRQPRATGTFIWDDNAKDCSCLAV